METKKTVRTVLLVFTAVAITYLAVTELLPNPRTNDVSNNATVETARNTRTAESQATGTAAGDAGTSARTPAPDHKVMVYLFHGRNRCPSCVKMEELTTEAMKSGFPDQLLAGSVEFQAINAEERQNRHFIQDYGLTSISIIISDQKRGRETIWKNLNRVWDLLRDEKAFISYIQQEVRAYLEAGS